MSRRSELQSAFSSLPERYLGAEPGFDATYHVRIHVPQVERPERTNGLLERFLGHVNALGAPTGELRAA